MNQNPSPAPENKPRQSHHRQRRQSVVQYIAILFAAAFVLLGMSYAMERRQNAQEVDDLKKQSTSAMQSVENLFQENQALKQQVEELEEQLQVNFTTIKDLTDTLSHQEHLQTQTEYAMDLFWQIDESYVKSRWSLCRQLMQKMEDEGLSQFLPQESYTDNGRFSPADRYAEIRHYVLHQ